MQDHTVAFPTQIGNGSASSSNINVHSVEKYVCFMVGGDYFLGGQREGRLGRKENWEGRLAREEGKLGRKTMIFVIN